MLVLFIALCFGLRCTLASCHLKGDGNPPKLWFGEVDICCLAVWLVDLSRWET